MSETLVIQPDLSAAPQTPAWDRTVPRHLVHRRSVAEVLLTDALRVSDTRFLIAAQWPLRHSTFRPDPEGRHDPVFVVETIRQMGLLIPRVFLGSPRTPASSSEPSASPWTPPPNPARRTARATSCARRNCRTYAKSRPARARCRWR
ncbi:hypothetical protein F3K43_03990 [Streptomyces sp. LBUM 1476]|nr:hypothetical protein [Streptomyces sp. LBUM 1476]